MPTAYTSDCQPHLAATQGKQALTVNQPLLETGGYEIYEGKAFAYLLWTGNFVPLFVGQTSVIDNHHALPGILDVVLRVLIQLNLPTNPEFRLFLLICLYFCCYGVTVFATSRLT